MEVWSSRTLEARSSSDVRRECMEAWSSGVFESRGRRSTSDAEVWRYGAMEGWRRDGDVAQAGRRQRKLLRFGVALQVQRRVGLEAWNDAGALQVWGRRGVEIWSVKALEPLCRRVSVEAWKHGSM